MSEWDLEEEEEEGEQEEVELKEMEVKKKKKEKGSNKGKKKKKDIKQLKRLLEKYGESKEIKKWKEDKKKEDDLGGKKGRKKRKKIHKVILDEYKEIKKKEKKKCIFVCLIFIGVIILFLLLFLIMIAIIRTDVVTLKSYQRKMKKDWESFYKEEFKDKLLNGSYLKMKIHGEFIKLVHHEQFGEGDYEYPGYFSFKHFLNYQETYEKAFNSSYESGLVLYVGQNEYTFDYEQYMGHDNYPGRLYRICLLIDSSTDTLGSYLGDSNLHGCCLNGEIFRFKDGE